MVTHLEMTSREPVLAGRPFGAVGPYEALTGSAYFAVDPEHELNRPIVDLDLAPVDAEGRVTCRADMYILKPADPARGNRNLFYHVVNRGRKGILATFNLAEGSNLPQTEAEFGDGFLMRKGYTVVACGWQADVPPEAPDNPNLMTLDVPVALQDGAPVRGPVRSEIVVDQETAVHVLGSRYHEAYEAVDPEEPEATLTVRARPYDPPEAIPREKWAFARLEGGRPVPSVSSVHFPDRFQPGLIYEVVYTGVSPKVMGLGFAATRDCVSFLKYEPEDGKGQPNPLAGADGRPEVDRAYAFGSSQSGRFLRHLLYLGFNQDEAGRQVLDGVMANVAGGARGSFNHRFAQPSRHTCAHTDQFYPTEQFPFTDLPQTDPETGAEGGLLDRCEQMGVTPRIFYTNTSTEYWNRGASLVHTDLEGGRDVPVHENARFYHFSSTQHGPGALPQGGRKALPANPVNFRYALRALLVALDAWVREGEAPPESRYGTLAEGMLVEPGAVGFPRIPGLSFPEQMRQPHRLDYGPEWVKGIITKEPPEVGHPYGVRLPRTDGDGNEVAGIRMPEVTAPLGTFTGWRLRHPANGAPDALVGLAGMWVPFARTEADRETAGDPRPSVAARYSNRKEYVGRVAEATLALVRERLMLPQDVPRVLERAGEMYGWVMKSK